MPADFKKVVFQPHLCQPQNLGPDRGNLTLPRGDRWHKALLQGRSVGLRQRFTVEFSVGCQRHPLQKDQIGRHHVVRQLFTQSGFELFAKAGLLLLRHRLMGDHISQQLVLLGHHHGFAHSGLLTQARLNFPQFDTEPADLDLMVDAADVLDHAFLAITRQVARAIQPLAVAREGIGHKALGGQRRPPVISTGQANTADQQFAADPDRAWRELGIEYKQ